MRYEPSHCLAQCRTHLRMPRRALPPSDPYTTRTRAGDGSTIRYGLRRGGEVSSKSFTRVRSQKENKKAQTYLPPLPIPPLIHVRCSKIDVRINAVSARLFLNSVYIKYNLQVIGSWLLAADRSASSKSYPNKY